MKCHCLLMMKSKLLMVYPPASALLKGAYSPLLGAMGYGEVTHGTATPGHHRHGAIHEDVTCCSDAKFHPRCAGPWVPWSRRRCPSSASPRTKKMEELKQQKLGELLWLMDENGENGWQWMKIDEHTHKTNMDYITWINMGDEWRFFAAEMWSQ